MKVIIIIIGVLLSAFVTALLYAIGLKKKMHEGEDLSKKLLNKASLEVETYVRKHGSIDYRSVDGLIENLKVSHFYSRNSAMVQNSKEFKKSLMDFMVEKQILEEKMQNGQKVYILGKKS